MMQYEESLVEESVQRREQLRAAMSTRVVDAGGVFRPDAAGDPPGQSLGAKLHSGWMAKKKPFPKRSHLRWFVLRECGELHYFEDEDERVRRGLIDLRGLPAGSVRGGKEGQLVIEGAASGKGKVKDWVLVPGGGDAGRSWAEECASEWRRQVLAAIERCA